MGFPAPPRPLKVPASVPAGTATTPIPKFCNFIRFRIFHFLSPHPPTGGEWDGMGNRTKKPGSSCPRPSALSAVFEQPGNKKGSRTRELPAALVSSHFPNARSPKTRGRWELPPRSQQTSTQQARVAVGANSLHALGSVISSAVSEKPAKSSYASLQCVAFSCHFFHNKRGSEARSLSPPSPPPFQKEPNGYKGGGEPHSNLRGDASEVWLVFKYPICQCKGSAYVYKVPFASDSSRKPAMRGLGRWMRRGSATLTESKVRSSLPRR